MAPRANWKGFLRLSLVTCPIALFPATSESEKISFNQINKKTGHRIRYLKVDAETGDEVPNEDIIKGYQVDTDRYLEVTKDELENIALESTRTIDINEFVPRKEIDDLYLVRPYFIVPDGKVGHDAYAVIRDLFTPGELRGRGFVLRSEKSERRIRRRTTCRASSHYAN
jgi:DNA end-binding protein Ku